MENVIETGVTTTVTVEGEPDEVWELLTDDDELSTWLGDEVTLDPVPDGTGHLVDDDGVGREIRVDEVEPGRSISWRWWPDGDDDRATRVAIELVPGDDGTEIRVTEWVATMHVVPVTQAWSGRTLSAELTMLSRHLVLAGARV
jgi:uncharacterized protein YndB with AHSA1/START domain